MTMVKWSQFKDDQGRPMVEVFGGAYYPVEVFQRIVEEFQALMLDKKADADLDPQEVRARYPFRPYEIAIWNGKSEVEVISWPFPDGDDGCSIYIRTRVDDPTSMVATRARRLSKKQL